MYVELPEGVCCNIVTANKHTGISTLKVKAKFTTQQQAYNRILYVQNLTKRYFLFYVRLYYTTFAVNLIKTTRTVSLQRDNHNVEMCLISSEISIIFSSATTVTSINLI